MRRLCAAVSSPRCAMSLASASRLTPRRLFSFFQARHSYIVSDIEFNKAHVPCLTVSQQGSYIMDLYRFHSLEEAPPCDHDPYFPTVL